MDALDLRILRTMGLRPFAQWPPRPGGLKPSAVAEVLGCKVELVKDRIDRMESSGLIRGYRVFPNMRLFGLDLVSHHFVAGREGASGLLEQVARVDGVVGAYDYVGGDLCVDVSYRTPAEKMRRLRLVADLLRVEEGPYGFYEREFPEVKRSLTPLDWRLLAALRRGARRPVSDLAAEVGVTTKTVRVRRNRLRAEGVFDEYVDIDLTAVPGIVVFGMAFWFRPQAQRKVVPRLIDLLDDHYLAAWKPPANGLGSFDMDLYATSISEMRELEEQARRVPDVERVASLVPRGGFYNEAWVDEMIESAAAQPAAR